MIKENTFIKYLKLSMVLLLFSCSNGSLTANDLKTGTYKSILNGHKTESFAIRNKTYQIETYNKKIDTFLINWKSNFEYILIKKNPKNALDSTAFIVKITGIHKNYYTFKAHFKGNKFIQAGKTYKIKD